MADYFEEVIDRVEKKYNCTVIYFTTDSDGGAKKGRLILQERRPWLLVPQCFAHQVCVFHFINHSSAVLLNYFPVSIKCG
jgi:hypothetical protein